ncbi:MAG TPA: ABC transporter permease, partial [Vicinamibacterales bacterium]|nr:ABC transporter permease [Vicinamibacterales bacterium]
MLRTFWSKVTALLRGRRSLREDLRADMDAHLELDVEARVQGGTPEETTRSAAVRAFGNRTLIRETGSEAWTFRAVETFVQDVRLGLRAMTNEPGLATAVVLSLGIGIGASTAVFRVVDALVFRDLAVDDPAGLLVFRRSYAGDGRAPYGFDYSWFERYQRLDDVFAGVAAVHVLERADPTAPMSNGSGPVIGDPQVRVSAVTGNYFSVLGARMHLGRALSDVDDGPEERPVAVISDRYWQRRFNREPDVLGRPVTINGTPFSILGVAERGFSGEWLGRPTDVWVPVSSLPRAVSELPSGNRRGGGLAFRLLGRLRPGVSIEQARSRGQVVYQQILHEERAGRSATTERLARIARARFDMEPAAKGFSPQRASHWPPLALLGGMTGLVLLLACANAAGLLLARLAERRRELSIRVAIGAGPLRLAHQLLAESLALSVCATAVGLLLSHWGTRLLAAWISTGPASGVAEQLTLDLQPDGRLIVFAAALCLLTVVGFGVGPAAMAARS